jgi:hypothetical protein
MMQIRQYLLSVCSAALLSASILSLTPKGRVRQIVKVGSSIVLMIAVLSPLVSLNAEKIAKSLAMRRMDIEQMQTGVEIKNRDLLSQIIKEKSEEYILDKAREMGLELEVDLTMRDEGDYPYPISAKIEGCASDTEKMIVTKIVEQDIGIDAEHQEWITLE